MAMPPEAVVERRRLTRRVVFWRSAAALAAAVAIIAIADAAGLGDLLGGGGDRVATLDVQGVIVSDEERREALTAARDDDGVKALVVRIDSPGGTFVGSDDLHQTLREVAAKKPVVAVINDVAASGGYMTAIAADRVFARRGSITESVGVIFQSPRVSRLMESVGVDMDVWRSGELKARPSPFEETPEAARAQAQEMVDRLFGMFLDMVQARRELSADARREIADGRVVTGDRALELGLIDALGDEKTARDWLEAEKGVDADLPSDDITPPPRIERGGILGGAIALIFGAGPGGANVGLSGLSGLLALWRPLAPAGALK